MAEHVATPPGSAMDYREHERTYDGFIRVSQIVTLESLATVMGVAIFGFGGFWLGILAIFIVIGTSALSLAAGRTSKPALYGFFAVFILMIFSLV